MERVHSFTLLGTTISADLTWSNNTMTVIRKAQQRLHFLRKLRRNDVSQELLVTFYRSTIESILSYGITVWFSHCTEAERQSLQRVVKTAQRIISCPLPSLKDIYQTRCLSRVTSITTDSTHPAFPLFELLPSGRRYRSIRTRTNRLRNSFFPQAIMIRNAHTSTNHTSL